MDEQGISYEHLVERALRGVLREALILTQETGLPGQHHFYITFRTHHPDVRIPSHLKAVHPEDMTIVLQHQFWNLTVDDEYFEVDLSFKGKMERLHIPFDAVTAFADPHAKFGLQFQIDLDSATEALLDDEPEDNADLGLESPDDDAPVKKDEGEAAPDESRERGEDGDNVVPLDAFRKE